MSRMSSLGYSAAAAPEEEVYAESELGEPELTISQMSRLNGVSCVSAPKRDPLGNPV